MPTDAPCMRSHLKTTPRLPVDATAPPLIFSPQLIHSQPAHSQPAHSQSTINTLQFQSAIHGPLFLPSTARCSQPLIHTHYSPPPACMRTTRYLLLPCTSPCTSLHLPAPPPSPLHNKPCPGLQQVLISGLVTRSELNGCQGVVLGMEGSRYVVELTGGGGQISLSPSNLVSTTASPPPVDPPPQDLPSGWVEASTEDGVSYYANTLTGETSWERPPVETSLLRAGWEEVRSVCVCACLLASLHARVHSCVRASIPPSVRACLPACVAACVRAPLHACVRACVCVCARKPPSLFLRRTSIEPPHPPLFLPRLCALGA